MVAAMSEKELRICDIDECGRAFYATHHLQKFCCDACRDEGERRRKRRWEGKHREAEKTRHGIYYDQNKERLNRSRSVNRWTARTQGFLGAFAALREEMLEGDGDDEGGDARGDKGARGDASGDEILEKNDTEQQQINDTET